MESNRTADRGSTLSQCQVASEELERLIREFNGGVGPSDIHLVATLHFDSLDALKAGMASPEGRAAGGDLANFADGGADLYFFDTKEV